LGRTCANRPWVVLLVVLQVELELLVVLLVH
jgi:hypothetical protein